MEENHEERQAIQEIGFKSTRWKLEYTTWSMIALSALYWIVLFLYLVIGGSDLNWKNLLALLITFVAIPCAIYMRKSYHKAPECLIKMDDEVVYIWCKGRWELLLKSSIARVDLVADRRRVGLNIAMSGSMRFQNKDGKRYWVLYVDHIDEVKMKLGISNF